MRLDTVPLSFIYYLCSFRKGLRSQGGEDWDARMARGSPGPWVVLWVCLALAVDFSKGQEERPFGETCLEDFTAGMPDLVLDTDASVQNGATFLSSPTVHRSRDCMRACCKDPACNLALVEQVPGTEEDRIQGCFLLNCLYEQAFVCQFAKKTGFLNFLRKNVYDSYLAMQDHGSSGKVPLMDLCKLGLEEHERPLVPAPPAIICAALLPNSWDKAILKMGFCMSLCCKGFSLTLINSLKIRASVYLLVNGGGIIL